MYNNEEAGEELPLKQVGRDEACQDAITAKENEANMGVSVVGMSTPLASGGKELRSKGVRGWLEKQQVKWCLAIMVALILLGAVLLGTLLIFGEGHNSNDDIPRLIRMVPRPNRDDNILYFQHGPLESEDGKEWGPLRDSLDRLVEGYNMRDPSSNMNVTECVGAQPPEGFSCFFDINKVDPECSSSFSYGYERGTPCVFLQFNNISNWRPEAFNTRDIESNKQLPSHLRENYQPNVVYLDCQGLTLIDREHIGLINYSPERGFKTNYFPYTGQPDYMPPVVVVRFQKPQIGVAINVVCKLWAKNINHTEHTIPTGSIHFTLLID